MEHFWYCLGFWVFVSYPFVILAIGVWFLEDVDSTSDTQWNLGKRDPFRQLIYDRDRQIRPQAKVYLFCLAIVCLLVTTTISLIGYVSSGQE